MLGIMQKLFGLGAVLDFNSKDAVARMGTAERAAGALRKGMLQIGVGARTGAAGLGQFALATLPLSTGLGLAVREAMKFEDGLARIGTMLDEAGLQRIPQLGKDIDDLSVRYGQAADVLSEAGFTAVSAFGLNDQTAGFLEDASRMATAGFTTVDVAMAGMVGTLKAYGLGVDQATKVSDAFFVANSRGRTTIGDMASAIGNVASTAAKLGVNYDDLMAAIATGSNVMPSTAETITGIKAALAAIAGPSGEAEDAFKRMGIAFGPEAVKKMGGLLPYLQQVQEKTGGNTKKLHELFGGSMEAFSAISALTGALGDYGDTLGMMQQGGATDKAFAVAEKTAGFQFRQLQQMVMSIVRGIGGAILPVFNEILGPLRMVVKRIFGDEELMASFAEAARGIGAAIRENVLPYVERLMGWWQGLSRETKAGIAKAVLWVGGLGAAIAAVAAVLAPVVLGLSGIASVAEGAGTALAAMASPVTIAAVLAIAGAGAAVAEKWDYVKQAASEFGSSFLDTMQGVAEDTKANLQPALDKVLETLKDIFSTIIGDGKTAKATWGEIGTAVASLVGIVSDVVTAILKIFGPVFNFIADTIIRPAIGTFKNTFGGLIDILTGNVEIGVVSLFRGLIGGALLPFQAFVRRLLELVQGALHQVQSLASHVIGFEAGKAMIGGAVSLADRTIAEFDAMYGGPFQQALLTGSYAPRLPGAAEASQAFRPPDISEWDRTVREEDEARAAAEARRIEAAVAAGAEAGASRAKIRNTMDGRDFDRAAGRRAARDADRTGTPVSPSQRAYMLRGSVIVAAGSGR